MSKSLSFSINGTVTQSTCRPDTTVLEWLRQDALLRGTKEGCAEGDCGACSILLRRAGDEKFAPANSCILLMGQIEGAELMTVEGLAASGADGHPIQKHMAANGSSQCGFCTPGIVSALAGLLERTDRPTDPEIHDALAGNLCRCTGYRPIVEAAHAAAKELEGKLTSVSLDVPKPLVGDADCTFFLPTSLQELLDLKAEHSDAVLLAGGTDIALDVAHAKARWPKTILTREVSQLRKIDVSDTHVEIGGAATWEDVLPLLHEHWPSFATLARRFGSTQIRFMGTIAGNLGTGSPIGDGAPTLLALNAVLHLTGTSGTRAVALDNYFTGYRKSVLKGDEIIEKISIPLPPPDQQFRVYKVSKRYDQDISTVCGAFAFEVVDGVIKSARIAYGGMAATPMRCEAAEKLLTGRTLPEACEKDVKSAIVETFQPVDDMRGSARYRSRVAANLVERFVLDLAGKSVEVMEL